MGITWDKKAIEHIIGALLAAHPGFVPEYKTMALYFGNGATYDSMQGRFREYRKIAERMRQENPGAVGSETPVRRNPSTPGSGRVTKPTSTAKNRRIQGNPTTPTKSVKGKRGVGMMGAILLDGENDSLIKSEDGAGNGAAAVMGVKSENRFAGADISRNGYVDSKANGYSDDVFQAGWENGVVTRADDFENAVRFDDDSVGYDMVA
ncbi:hypothetical protein AJ79_00223 [Helicocarpus griseus UAMH5409]|uniref:Uncharacterized protein n=1 Tax=Helicocarpus griseus UAMH5409 TaxID=1447875 RepID=A0A2B7YC82_9EURO|nr:hypothetical protein AJ79_00223 [Helicocarpus griseus UAMH5409]